MEILKKLFLLPILLLYSCLAFSQNGLLSGKIVDSKTKSPLAGAYLHVKGYNKVVSAGNEGEYAILLPLDTSFMIQATYIGYTPYDFQVCLASDSTINILMDSSNELSKVYVYGEKNDFGAKSAQMSAISVPIEQIKGVPALFGEVDVMKVLQKLPGVQSMGDGASNIYVRGGNYDQNLITLDGSTLYNSEHLKGFVSAVNSDIINNLLLYKGGFPARYGARISSVVDIGVKEGNFKKIGGSVGIGMLASKVHVEGPVLRERTSFNIAARASYFDAIVFPVLKKIYDKPRSLQPYANMNFYDVNAKLVHRFSDRDKISAVFYWGKDVNDSAPTESFQKYSSVEKVVNNTRGNSAENQWGNMVSSLFYTHRGDNNFFANVNLSFSRYDYRLKIASDIRDQISETITSEVLYKYVENSYTQYNSDIKDLALSVDFQKNIKKHNVRWGAKVSSQRFDPIVDVFKDCYKKIWKDGRYFETAQYVDTILGQNHNMQLYSLYAEDDFEFGKKWKMNFGLRYSLYAVKDKSYHSLEPRVSLRFLINDRMALKGSYSRMVQGLHLLSSSNLVMPSDIWVPVTKNVPLITSNQWAVGYNCNIIDCIDFSVEGYYKTMENLMEYGEGTSYTKVNGDWQNQIVLGKGRAFGVELLVEKRLGRSTGWIGYTWSKSLRKFDSDNNILNGGSEFYAGNDCRHNINIVWMHTFNKHWKVSGSWTYKTGRRGTLPTTSIYGGKPDEYDAFGNRMSSDTAYSGNVASPNAEHVIYLDKFLKYYTYRQRNGFVLPDIHRLDVSVTYTTDISVGELDLSLDICNLYNRMNISNVYIGYHNNKTVLKGVCVFPFMPSFNICLHF